MILVRWRINPKSFCELWQWMRLVQNLFVGWLPALALVANQTALNPDIIIQNIAMREGMDGCAREGGRISELETWPEKNLCHRLYKELIQSSFRMLWQQTWLVPNLFVGWLPTLTKPHITLTSSSGTLARGRGGRDLRERGRISECEPPQVVGVFQEEERWELRDKKDVTLAVTYQCTCITN